MSNIEFEDNTNFGASQNKIMYSRLQPSNKAPGVIVFLLKKKIVKNERQAIILLLTIVVICVIVSILAFRAIGSAPVFTPAEVINSVAQRSGQ